VAGRVLRVFQESERAVASGTPLLELGDPSDLEIVVEMLSRDGASLAPGTRALLEQWGGPAPLEGRVRLVEPAAFTKVSALGVEEQRVNVVVDLVTPAAERAALGDSFRVEARVVVWEQERVLQVPSAALFRRGGAWAAFVVRDGRARLVAVEAGRSSGPATQVVSGLAEGDEVILYPGDRVTDGQRVAPMAVAR
jgi:HlyD family secretion protein